MNRKQLYKQCGTALVAGVGAYTVHRMTLCNKQNDPLFSDAPRTKLNPSLCRAVKSFSKLEQDENTRRLVHMVEQMLTMEADRESEWIVNRKVQDIRRHCTVMIQMAKKSRDDRITEQCIELVDEEFPLLEGILDAIVHNMILDRSN